MDLSVAARAVAEELGYRKIAVKEGNSNLCYFGSILLAESAVGIGLRDDVP